MYVVTRGYQVGNVGVGLAQVDGVLSVIAVGLCFLLIVGWWVVSVIALPAGASAALPLVVVALAVHYLPTLPASMFKLHHRLLDKRGSRLAIRTKEWLSARLRALGLGHITIHEVGADAFDPAVNTILLSDHIANSRCVKSRATAAHELGHALLYNNRPRLAKLLWWCRTWNERLFFGGLSLLIASVVIAVPNLPSIGYGLIAAGALATVGILVDEALASMSASRVLDLDIELTRRDRHDAGTSLALAFFSYAVQLAVMVLPLLFPPALGPGLIAPAGPLAGAWAVVAGVGAVVALVCSALAVASFAVGHTWWTGLSVFASIVCPAFVFAVAGQPQVLAHPWTIALAVTASWTWLIAPAHLILHFGLGRLTRGLDADDPHPRWSELESYVKLRSRPSPYSPSWLERRLPTALNVLPFLPIALAYLGLF